VQLDLERTDPAVVSAGAAHSALVAVGAARLHKYGAHDLIRRIEQPCTTPHHCGFREYKQNRRGARGRRQLDGEYEID
jgi:hypothetical protein